MSEQTEQQYQMALENLKCAEGDNVVMELVPEVVAKLKVNGYRVEESEIHKHIQNIDWNAVAKKEGMNDIEAYQLMQSMQAPRTEKLYRIFGKNP